MPTWMDTLRDLLCQMYQELGGDCADLQPPANQEEPPENWAPVEAILAVCVTTPPIPSGVTVARCDEVLSHLSDGGNILETADSAALVGRFTDLRNAVGA
jgi:hypothetical protein